MSSLFKILSLKKKKHTRRTNRPASNTGGVASYHLAAVSPLWLARSWGEVSEITPFIRSFNNGTKVSISIKTQRFSAFLPQTQLFGVLLAYFSANFVHYSLQVLIKEWHSPVHLRSMGEALRILICLVWTNRMERRHLSANNTQAEMTKNTEQKVKM